jgi:hypothetical protein
MHPQSTGALLLIEVGGPFIVVQTCVPVGAHEHIHFLLFANEVKGI